MILMHNWIDFDCFLYKMIDKRNEICYNQGEDESRNPIGMKISYMLIASPKVVIWDLVVNGGYGKWEND